MSQNTNDTGRTKIKMPEFRFDTIDSGEALYNTMFSMFERISNDSIKCRTKAFTLDNNAQISFDHNINMQQSGLEIRVQQSGVDLSEEDISAKYEVTYTDTNSIVFKNVSGSTQSGWLIVSSLPGNLFDQTKFRNRAGDPVVEAGQIAVYCKDNNIYAKNSVGTVMGMTDSQVIMCPPGVVLSFAGAAVPSGFLSCNGAEVSRSTYANLFAAIGTAHGAGDGANTFHLPDYRGRFLRGVDGTASRDPDKTIRTAMAAGGASGNVVGSVQTDDYASHNHTQNSHNHTQNSHNHNQDPHGHDILSNYTGSIGGTRYVNTYDPIQGMSLDDTIIRDTTATNQANTATNNATTATNQATGGNETRPENAYVNYIIKY